MDEFLEQNYLIITPSLEFIAAITGLINYKKFKHTPAKYFIWFLCYIALEELLGTYSYYIRDFEFLFFLKGTRFRYNYWWFNLFWEIGGVLFFAFYYSKIFSSRIYANVAKYSGMVFLVYSFICVLSDMDLFFTGYFPSIRLLGALVIFSCSVLYFIETLQSDKILIFYKSLNFYISAIIFVWWLIITPLVFYDVYKFKQDKDFVYLKWQIYLFANIFMYLSYTFALIWCRPEKN